MRFLLIPALFGALFTPGLAQAEVPRVAVTIKPLHSLVAAVMGDLGSPELIVDGVASPHSYSLTPSDAEMLQAAKLVFWTGHGLELFLDEALHTLAVEAEVIELAATPGLDLLPVREGGAFEEHEEGEGGDHGHEQEAIDMHFWLDPDNGARLVTAIADTLAASDPEHASTYGANAEAYNSALAALTEELSAALAAAGDAKFIVFHDALQYFERRFGLSAAGAITITPDTMPGARRIGELRAMLGANSVSCVFAEPQFEPAIIGSIIEGTGARAGEVDPEGADLPAGPGLYPALLRELAADLLTCLDG